MAKDRKRSRSLFELMDPKGVYRAPAIAGRNEKEEPEVAEAPAEKEVEQAAEPEPIEKAPAAKEVTAEPKEAAEPSVEPFASVGDGKVRLVMNYPLAIMLCFAAVILLICAALVGWRLGRDNALKIMQNWRVETNQEQIETDPWVEIDRPNR